MNNVTSSAQVLRIYSDNESCDSNMISIETRDRLNLRIRLELARENARVTAAAAAAAAASAAAAEAAAKAAFAALEAEVITFEGVSLY